MHSNSESQHFNNLGVREASKHQLQVYCSTKSLTNADHIALLMDEWYSTKVFIDLFDKEVLPFLIPPYYTSFSLNSIISPNLSFDKPNNPSDIKTKTTYEKQVKICFNRNLNHYVLSVIPSNLFNTLSPARTYLALQALPISIASQYDWRVIKDELISKYQLNHTHKQKEIKHMEI